MEFSTAEIIKQSVRALADLNQFPAAKKPVLEARTARLSFNERGIEGNLSDIGRTTANVEAFPIPDIYGYIQTHVDVSRYTIYEIINQTKRAKELLTNPQTFLDHVVTAIKQTLNTLLVDGIKYEKINGQFYEMQLFRDEEMETYLSDLIEATDPDKTLYNYIRHESSFEENFARDAQADENIKFFFKLPRGFKIPTPLGNYNPDWAVIFENDARIYFVVETKGTLNKQQLRELERLKIDCGEKHFAVLDIPNLQYKLATTNKDLLL